LNIFANGFYNIKTLKTIIFKNFKKVKRGKNKNVKMFAF